ncbi:unnamed protein product, partial [Candidula unifasciata]
SLESNVDESANELSDMEAEVTKRTIKRTSDCNTVSAESKPTNKSKQLRQSEVKLSSKKLHKTAKTHDDSEPNYKSKSKSKKEVNEKKDVILEMLRYLNEN